MTLRSLAPRLALVLLLLLAPSVEAQQSGKIYKVGVLLAVGAQSAAPFIEVGRQRMRELGYVEGQNLSVEYRFAAGKMETLPDLATELVRANVDLIVALGDITVHAAKQSTRTVPIVMILGGDPVATGLVSTLARPGGNITGVASMIPELNGKMLALLKESAPKTSRVTVLWNPNSLSAVVGFKDMQAVARTVGVTLSSVEVRKGEELDRAFAAIVQERPDALMVLTDPVTFNRRGRVVEFAAKNRLPAMYEIREFVDEGGLIAYGPSMSSMIRRGVVYIDRILKGAKPGDLPVEQPTTFELVVNMKTARVLGLTVPPSLLLRADQVIE